MILGGFLSRTQILGVALVCAVLQEAFSNLPENEAVMRLLFSSAGFVGTGLFISEMIRNRRMDGPRRRTRSADQATPGRRRAIAFSDRKQSSCDRHHRFRRQSAIGKRSSSAFARPGRDALARPGNQLLSSSIANRSQDATTASISHYSALHGKRSDGEVFLAGVWFSTYSTISGPRLAAIIVDLSEDLRNREDLSLDHLLKNTRILMSAVAHEIRNLCGAVLSCIRTSRELKSWNRMRTLTPWET